MILSRRTLTIAAACTILGLAFARLATAHNWLGKCDVYFDNEFALEHIDAQARSTSFEDPNLTCFVDPGDGKGAGFGRPKGSDCQLVNWGSEPRYLQSHVKDHWISIWLEDRVTHKPRVFDLPQIYVSGDQPIQFWFKRTDGSWWCWKELAPRNRWNLKKWAHDLIEVRLTGAGSGGGPYTIRGFTIQD